MPLEAVTSRIEVPAGVPAANEQETEQRPRRVRRPRRTRSPHPGIVLIRPDAEHAHWRARYVDPDTGRSTKVKLDALAVPTAEARREWAIRKARSLAKRRMELETGAPRATGTALEAAVDRYYEANKQLRPKTLRDYHAATRKLLAWASANGVHSADDITRAKLIGFREQICAEPKRAAARGGKRGTRKATREPRSAHSINRELRAVRVVLGYLAECDLLPKVREGELRRALKKRPTPTEHATFLRSPEIAALIEAALAHDAETFVETRAEHVGEGTAGTTPRFVPVAPFVVVLLLTGLRLGEALALQWSQVDLDAVGDDGAPLGDIRLNSATKTRQARVIDLAVSPMLRELLEALRERGKRTGKVFPAIGYDAAGGIAKRLRTRFEAPEAFGWQTLRSTCGTFLTNAPGIFGAASAYRSARQLGHSVAVAEKHYLGVLRVSAAARTLEEAMGIESLLARVTSNAKLSS
jgi:integrase